MTLNLKGIEDKVKEHNDHELCDGAAELLLDDIPALLQFAKDAKAALENIGSGQGWGGREFEPGECKQAREVLSKYFGESD